MTKRSFDNTKVPRWVHPLAAVKNEPPLIPLPIHSPHPHRANTTSTGAMRNGKGHHPSIFYQASVKLSYVVGHGTQIMRSSKTGGFADAHSGRVAGDKVHRMAYLARGSALTRESAPALVTKGPPSSGATPVLATSGISLGFPAKGNSLRSGW